MAKELSRDIHEAISRLIATQAFYAVLLMDLLKIEEVDNDPFVKTAGTDGRRLIIAKKFWASLKLEERIFLLAHEVLHVVFDHPGRGKLYADRGHGPDLKPFNFKKWNRAGDYVINDALIEGKVGVMPKVGLWDRSIGTCRDLEDDVYRRLVDEKDDGNGDGSTGMDQHMPPDGSAEGPSKAEVQRALKSAIQAQKSQGKVPEWMQRIVDELCEPQVSWPEEIRNAIVPVVGRDEMTWTRPNKRRIALAPHVYLPGRTSYRAGCIAVAADSSGSVGGDEWKAYFNEVGGIVDELRPEECWLMACAVECMDPQLVESSDDVRDFESTVGGGTHMPAIFAKLDEHGIVPDACVILTDGYTDFGEPQPYEVIWVITTKSIEAPHGRTVHINANQ